MKYQISLILLLSLLTTIKAHSKSTYIEYTNAATKAAHGLVYKYFGGERKLVDMNLAPAGTYKLIVEDKTGFQKVMYMLPDFKHIIDGPMYSPYITEIEDAHGLESLEKIAKKNSQHNKNMQKLESNLRQVREHSQPNHSHIKHNSEKQDQLYSSSTTKNTTNKQEITNRFPALATPKYLKKAPTLQPDENRFNVPHSNAKLYKAAQASSFISEGQSDKVMYIFMDYECGACVKMHPYFEKAITDEGIKIAYIPVGFMSDESKAKTILSLMPNDNTQRLKMFKKFIGFKKLDELIDTNSLPSDYQKNTDFKNAGERLIGNINIFYDLARPATPTAIFMTKNGPVTEVVASPKSLKSALKRIVADENVALVQQSDSRTVATENS